MNKHIGLYRVTELLIVLSIVVLAGCASIRPDSTLEKNWGRAYYNQLYLQIANPDAGKQAHPVMEMDGASSDAIMEAHRKSFEKSCKQETVNIVKLR